MAADWVAANPAMAATVMGWLGTALLALLTFIGVQMFRRVFGHTTPKAAAHVITAQEWDALQDEIKAIRAALDAGDRCFEDVDKTVRRLAVTAYTLCQAVVESTGKPQDCDELRRIITEATHAR